jgi:hypothetical protein
MNNWEKLFYSFCQVLDLKKEIEESEKSLKDGLCDLDIYRDKKKSYNLKLDELKNNFDNYIKSFGSQ